MSHVWGEATLAEKSRVVDTLLNGAMLSCGHAEAWMARREHAGTPHRVRRVQENLRKAQVKYAAVRALGFSAAEVEARMGVLEVWLLQHVP